MRRKKKWVGTIDKQMAIQHGRATGPVRPEVDCPPVGAAGGGGDERGNHDGQRPQVSPGVDQTRSSFRQAEGLTWRGHWLGIAGLENE